ncbi:MAG: transcription termination factor Rho [Lachnospirales bacterium]
MFKISENLNELKLPELKELGKKLKVENYLKLKKSDLIAEIEKIISTHEEKTTDFPSKTEENPAENQTIATENFRSEFMRESVLAEGILEILPEGFGFLRPDNFLPSDADIYVPPAQIRRFRLRTGDKILGNVKKEVDENRYRPLLYLQSINGDRPESVFKRHIFEDLTPIYPKERLKLETTQSDYSTRIIDLLSPIGKGQRGMIVSPPKSGKTELLKKIANSILENDKNIHLIMLLIDERPEEVTDIKESVTGKNVDVIYSTFDEEPEHHKRVAEMVLERAKRLVEHDKDIVILLDSITRLARAYNLIVPSSGRTLSGGLDPGSLYMPKKFFGAARNIKNGGSLTIISTALVDTGSKMDDVIFEEFKGTGNMELVLDRRLSQKRIFPSIDINKSSTRRDDLLLNKDEQDANYSLYKLFGSMNSQDALENLFSLLKKTENNTELCNVIKNLKSAKDLQDLT